jgi:outer membrane protein insertion porin family
MKFWLLLVVALVSARSSSAQARNAGTEQRRSPEVREVRITGVKHLSESELRAALSTQPSACLSILFKPVCLVVKPKAIYEHRYLNEDEFKRDVVRVLVFYFRRGYRDATVDTTVALSRDGVRITFAVKEGPPTVVGRVTVRAVRGAIVQGDTARAMRPRAGQPFNLLALDSSVARLRARLWNRGYADVSLTPSDTVNDTSRVAAIDIKVDRRTLVTIGSITVEGNALVSEETIRNSLTLKTGDLFRLSTLAVSQRHLYESALFRRAVIDTAARDSAAGIPDSVRALVVQVLEGPQREASTSFGFTTADFVQAEATFTHNYLAHRPLRLQTSVTVGNLLAQQLTKNSLFANISDIVRDNDLGRYYAPTYQANLDLQQRWFGSPRNTVGAGLFVHRRSAPGVLIDRGYGANATFTREVATRVPFSVHYQFEVTRVDAGDVYFCVNYGVCDNATISVLRGSQRLSPLSITASIDRTDIPFSPTRGVLARAELEHGSRYTGSDFHYNRAYVDAAAYKKIGYGNTVVGNTVVAAHVRAGWVAPLSGTAGAVGNGLLDANLQVLHPRKRFYAGGSQSVRGFGENQLGPRVLTVSSAALARGVTGADSANTPCSLTAPSAACLNGLKDDQFQTRPLGGTTLLEGSVELRIPLTRSIVGALFVDGAVLGDGTLSNIARGTGAVTPGFGVRYQSPVGPIRVDLGIRPSLQRALPVITEARDSTTGRYRLVDLTGGAGCPTPTSAGCRIYGNPLEKKSFINRITSRLTLHLSIGEAY